MQQIQKADNIFRKKNTLTGKRLTRTASPIYEPGHVISNNVVFGQV